MTKTKSEVCIHLKVNVLGMNFLEPMPLMELTVWQKNTSLPHLNSSDLGGVIDIADPVTGTLIFIKLGYLKNFMSNKCSMKCLWASENQRNWIFDIIY